MAVEFGTQGNPFESDKHAEVARNLRDKVTRFGHPDFVWGKKAPLEGFKTPGEENEFFSSVKACLQNPKSHLRGLRLAEQERNNLSPERNTVSDYYYLLVDYLMARDDGENVIYENTDSKPMMYLGECGNFALQFTPQARRMRLRKVVSQDEKPILTFEFDLEPDGWFTRTPCIEAKGSFRKGENQMISNKNVANHLSGRPEVQYSFGQLETIMGELKGEIERKQTP